MNNKKGFTLIEIIIALTLLVIIIPAFTGAILSALDNEEDMDRRLEANRISSSIIETLKTDAYDLAELASNSESLDIDWNEEENIENKDLLIKITNTKTPKLYRIQIECNKINYSLETLIAGED